MHRSCSMLIFVFSPHGRGANLITKIGPGPEPSHFFVKSVKIQGPGSILILMGIGKIPAHPKQGN